MYARFSILLIVFALVFQSCSLNSGNGEPVNRDTTITPATSFNNLFFDSSKIAEFLEKEPRYANYAEQYIDFYRGRNFQYAWFDSSGLSEQALNFINLENNYIQDMADSSLHHPRLTLLKDSLLNRKKIKPAALQ
ncbi:MAG: hypothetical protein ACK5BO_02570, partial [Bacteroidota bacterium]